MRLETPYLASPSIASLLKRRPLAALLCLLSLSISSAFAQGGVLSPNKNIEALKKAVQGHYAHEHPDLLKEIDGNMEKLDSIVDKLDHRLADSLAKAHAAPDDAARKAELKNAKIILADYIKYVKTEPLIAHIDSNPFGVNTNLKKVLTESLTHMAQAIG